MAQSVLFQWVSDSLIRYVPSWNHYDITKPHSPHSGPKHQYFFVLHVTRLPQKDICDQKHAVWPNLSRLVQRIKHRKSHNSRPSTHSYIDSDVILIEILRRGNAKNKTLWVSTRNWADSALFGWVIDNLTRFSSNANKKANIVVLGKWFR